MCRSSPPPPTNPLVTSAANQAGNVNTAVANSILGNANVYGPTGSTTFNQIGTQPVKDALGNVIDVPRWQVTNTLSPEQKQIYDQQTALSTGMLGLAQGQVDRLGGVLGAPLDFSGIPKGGTLPTSGPQFAGLQAGPQFSNLAAGPRLNNITGGPTFARMTNAGMPIQSKLQLGEFKDRYGGVGGPDRSVGPQDWSADKQAVMQAMRAEAEPGFKQREAALAANLEAQGFRRGTEAFNRAMGDMNDARNRFELGVQQAGGAEQSRLAGQAFQQFGLENAAQQQAYNEALASMGLSNAARTAEGQFANQAQALRFAEAGQLAGFNNAAAQQAYQNAVGRTQYGNQLAQQGWQTEAQRAQFNNQAAQQAWQNAAAGTQYGNQMAQLGFGNATNLAQLTDTQRERAIQEMMLPRQTAINEIGAIRSGSQVQAPQFTPYQAGRIADTSVGGNILAADAMRNQQWQQQQQNTNAMIGGLAGIVGTGIQGGMQFGWPGTGTNFFGMQRA